MPAPISGSPMTYSVDGRQYIVVAVSGAGYTGEYISFALPQTHHDNGARAAVARACSAGLPPTRVLGALGWL